MDNESVSGDPQISAPSNGGVSRRSLMKAGAHAAWAIPMVQVVAAAPAIACSGAAAPEVQSASGQYTAAKSRDIAVTAILRNTGNSATTGLSVKFTFPSNENWQPTAASPLTGWSAAPNGDTLTYTAIAANQLAACSNVPFNPTIQINANKRGDEVSLVTVTIQDGLVQGPGQTFKVMAKR